MVGVAAEQLIRLEVPLRGGQGAVVLEREPGGVWRVVAPVDAPADPGVVAEITAGLVGLKLRARLPAARLSRFDTESAAA